jgi:protein involved in polysaccharide export with SLBB domain
MRFLQSGVGRRVGALCLAAAALAMAGCGTPRGTKPQAGVSPTNLPPARESTPLQIGDRIEVDLSGTPLPVEPSVMEISDQGTIKLAFISDPIQAAGKFPQDLAEVIRTNLVPRIYRQVNVTVVPRERYFYVSGEINQVGNGGRVLYLGRITVTGAIAAAGGFNDFAARFRVKLTRLDGTMHIVDCLKALDHPELDLEVFPGDKINVPKKKLGEVILGK